MCFLNVQENSQSLLFGPEKSACIICKEMHYLHTTKDCLVSLLLLNSVWSKWENSICLVTAGLSKSTGIWRNCLKKWETVQKVTNRKWVILKDGKLRNFDCSSNTLEKSCFAMVQEIHKFLLMFQEIHMFFMCSTNFTCLAHAPGSHMFCTSFRKYAFLDMFL